MKTARVLILGLTFCGATLFLTSCGTNDGGGDEHATQNENIGDGTMEPESTTGNTQETGVEGSGDLPGTAADDTSEYVNEVIGDDNAASGDSIQ